MDETEVALTTALRLQPAALQAIHHAQAQAQSHRGIPAASHLTPELQALDREESNAIQQRINDTGNVRHFHHPAVFDHSHIRRLPTQGQHHSLQQPQQHNQRLLQQHQHLNQRQNIGGQFGVLTPTTPLISVPLSSNSPAVPAQEDHEYLTAEQPKRDGHNDHMKFIPNPPDLEMWRNRLFNVDEMITLTEEEYQTYFPHVDNVYSHRSTQRYKRKSFVSHYWDCRLKGRPPGTPKSDDPNKRKRKRNARQRDLCDVKIKVTEYFSSSVQTQGFSPDTDSRRHEDNNTNFLVPSQPGETPPGPVQPFGVLKPSEANSPANIRVGPGQRYYTIQRVNGNGGNGKGDGASGPHKHTLEDSDRVKKSSIQRGLLHGEKEKKKSIKTYHKKATGTALSTVKKHSKESDLKLYGSCFCPFVQRVWIALELKGLPYQYVEIDPYNKPEALLEINPRGLVPALKHGSWGCYESTVILEYLEDLNVGYPLLPPNDARLRAHCRLWSDHINRIIVPGFYRCLQAGEPDKQMQYLEELKSEISKLVDACDPDGPFFLGPACCIVDVQFAPWMLRLSRVLKPYRSWPNAEEGSRWGIWIDAMEKHEAIKATTSSDELYLDSYERYAENRPNTSLVAKAINEGHELP